MVFWRVCAHPGQFAPSRPTVGITVFGIFEKAVSPEFSDGVLFMTGIPGLSVHLRVIARDHHDGIFWNSPVLQVQVFTVGSTEDIAGDSHAKRFGVDRLQQGLIAELGKVELEAPARVGGVYLAALDDGSNASEK